MSTVRALCERCQVFSNSRVARLQAYANFLSLRPLAPSVLFAFGCLSEPIPSLTQEVPWFIRLLPLPPLPPPNTSHANRRTFRPPTAVKTTLKVLSNLLLSLSVHGDSSYDAEGSALRMVDLGSRIVVQPSPSAHTVLSQCSLSAHYSAHTVLTVKT